MLNTFLPYLKCVTPLLAAGLLFLGSILTQRLITGTIITRPIPPGGFPSVEEEIRYVNDQPAQTRLHMKYRAWIIIAIVAVTCMPLSYFIPALIINMVKK